MFLRRVSRAAGIGGDRSELGIAIRTVVKPVPEVVEAMLDEVLGRSEVEPRIDCSMA